DDAADGRRRARKKRAVPHRGDGREVVVLGVGEYGAARQQLLETRLVVGAKSREVVIPELIDHNRQNQFRFLRRGRKQTGTGQQAGEELSHVNRPQPTMAGMSNRWRSEERT